MKFAAAFVVVVVGVLGVRAIPEKAEHGAHKPVPEHQHYPNGQHDTGYDHDAILGSHKTEQEFSHLSPEEAQARLRKLLLKMDQNEDGIISRSELEVWILHSFRQLDVEEAEARFLEYDTDKDGKLGWLEYLDKVYGMGEEEIDAMERNEETEAFLDMKDDDKLKFNAADLNKDGYLDSNEFVAFEYPYDFEHMHEVEMDRSMKELDKNKDGVISQSEFDGDLEMTEEDKIAQAENFKMYDTNEDGLMDRKEALPWILPDNKYAAKEEAEHLIGETDSNQDGVLSPDEIVDKHDLWVGSQVTNYGKHLNDEL